VFNRYKNPILLGRLIEKEDLDAWIDRFRERELEIDKELVGLVYNQAECDAALYQFCKSAEMNFKYCFDIDIKIDKVVRIFCGVPTAFPAVIELKPYDFCADKPRGKLEWEHQRIVSGTDFVLYTTTDCSGEEVFLKITDRCGCCNRLQESRPREFSIPLHVFKEIAKEKNYKQAVENLLGVTND